MKKWMSLLLAMVLCVTMLPLAMADEAPLPCRFYMPGAGDNMTEQVVAAINEKMQADGVNVELQLFYIPWDKYADKINTMLGTGEEFELFHVMEDGVSISQFAGRGAVAPLNDLIAQYTPELMGKFDEGIWTCATVGGKIMTVPAYWRDNSGDMEGYLAFNKTIFDKFGLEVPTSDSTLDEIIDVLTKLQKAWEEEDGITRYVYEHSNNRSPVALHRLHSEWPYFTTQDGVFAMYQDGTAKLFFETEGFKQDCEFMQKLYEAGLTHPDCLNQPADEITNNKAAGDFLMGIMTAEGDIYDSETQELQYDVVKVCPYGILRTNRESLENQGFAVVRRVFILFQNVRASLKKSLVYWGCKMDDKRIRE